MIIDTHAHLDFPDYKDDIDEVIERAGEVGVEYMINVGTTVASSNKSIELAKQYEQIYASIGIHPNEASKFPVRNGPGWRRWQVETRSLLLERQGLITIVTEVSGKTRNVCSTSI
jgi:Tat protein secretion system quality control protein TatD with DNase activity